MCGIVAVVSKNKMGLFDKDMVVFEQLLFADQLRGSDGTGIFYNTKDETTPIKIFKAPVPSSTLLNSVEYGRVRPEIVRVGNFVVGHNRAATKGTVNMLNTHPFKEKHITLIHNGTLHTQKELHPTVEVDSHAICHHILENGTEETLKKINGAFALIWANAKDKTLNICRNSQRPLHLFETKDFYVIVSEEKLGQWILSRNNVAIIRQFPIAINTLYSFPFEDMSKFVQKSVEVKQEHTSKFFSNGKWNSSNFYDSNEEFEPPKYISHNNKHVPHDINSTLKFKAGFIHRTGGTYLEGRLLYSKDKKISKRTDKDYEVAYRVRVYGKEEELEALRVKENLVGIVVTTSWAYGSAVYHMRDVREEKEPNNSVTEIPKNKCFYCTKEFKNGEVSYTIKKGKEKMCKTCMGYFSGKRKEKESESCYH